MNDEFNTIDGWPRIEHNHEVLQMFISAHVQLAGTNVKDSAHSTSANKHGLSLKPYNNN